MVVSELTELSVRMLEEEFGNTIPVCRCAAVAEVCDKALVFTDHCGVGIIDKRSDVFECQWYLRAIRVS